MSGGSQFGFDAQLRRRHRLSAVFAFVCRAGTWSALLILLVLLISVAGQVNHEGGLTVFIDRKSRDASVPELDLTDIESYLVSHEHVTGVERLVDPSGDISFVLAVAERKINEKGRPEFRYQDIELDLSRNAPEFADIELTVRSSEPVVGWSWQFLTNPPSKNFPERAGILVDIWGSLWLVLLTGLIAIPIGVGAAIYLEEYATDTWVTRLIKLNLANLAGVPSIVYGILGFAVFVRFFGKKLMLPGTDIQILPFGATVMAGASTLALLILPVIIVATQEALKSIPGSIRSASFALGATKWQTIRHQVLPAGMPGIATGVILALSRALGETAPIVVIGVLTIVKRTPGNFKSPLDLFRHPETLVDVPFADFATLPIRIYTWASESEPEFAAQAARGILVLLVVLLCINSFAIWLRNRYQKNLNW